MKHKYAIYKSRLGYLRIGYSNNRIIELNKVEYSKINNESRTDFTDKTMNEINEYLDGIRTTFDLPLFYQGTPFQNKVWKELLKIPYGETRTYQEIAENIDNPKACRAVGMACNKNPIAILIPCHRVIGKNKKLTGYAGGLAMKSFLINIETNKH